MRVVRVEHMGVMYRGWPSGPYSAAPMFAAEHDDFLECRDSGSCIHEWIEERCDIAEPHSPAPTRDGLPDFYQISNGRDYIFAFESIEAMNNWFFDVIHYLESFGFVAAVYETDNVYKGNRQLMFHYETATRVGDASLFDENSIVKMLDPTPAMV